MTVKVSKPAINVREELADLRKPTGIAGEAMLRAETPQEQFNLIGAGRRRINLNGAYQVWQRGTSATTVSNGLFLADRFKLFEGTDGSFTTERSTDAPEGFGYSNKFQVTTADTSLDSGNYVQYVHYLEGQDLQQLAYGTSSAKYVTLSFWVKSSKTGSYGLTYKKQGTAQYPAVFIINSANTWEKKVIVIPPLTTGSLMPNNNTIGMFLSWNLAFGSTYTNATADQWTTTGANYSTPEQVNWMDSTSNDFYITGVQLEVGKVATPFEHRSYGEELALCQRYYEKRPVEMDYTDDSSATAVYRTYTIPVEKRATPTIAVTSGLNYWSGGSSTALTVGSNVNINATSKTWAVNGYGLVSARGILNGEVSLDAEL
jgi:hypothetical protein